MYSLLLIFGTSEEKNQISTKTRIKESIYKGIDDMIQNVNLAEKQVGMEFPVRQFRPHVWVMEFAYLQDVRWDIRDNKQ